MTTMAQRAMSLLGKPRVLHGIPGRLRVHVPFLKTAVRENPRGVDALMELVSFVPGIESCDCSGVTGNVLIHFDAAHYTGEALLALIQQCTKVYIRYRSRFDAITPEQMPRTLSKLKHLISETVSTDKPVSLPRELPDDVFT